MGIRVTNNYGGQEILDAIKNGQSTGNDVEAMKRSFLNAKFSMQSVLINGTGSNQGLAGFDSFVSNPSVSKAQELLSQYGVGNNAGSTANGASTAAAEMRSLVNKEIGKFEDNMAETLKNAGVDTNKKATFLINDKGEMVVKDDHPDAAKIQELINSNATMRNEFSRISMLAEFVRKSEERASYTTMLAKNPGAAKLKYGDLVNGDAFSAFRLTMQKGLAGVEWEKVMTDKG